MEFEAFVSECAVEALDEAISYWLAGLDEEELHVQTSNYHRALAYRLNRKGFDPRLTSSLASARYREAMFNSCEKNNPKDIAVILALLTQGLTQRYYDPLEAGIHDLQDVSKTYHQIVLSRMRIQHTLLTVRSRDLIHI